MSRKLAWWLIVLATIGYCLLIWIWIQQGNAHQRQLQADQAREEQELRDKFQKGLVQ